MTFVPALDGGVSKENILEEQTELKLQRFIELRHETVTLNQRVSVIKLTPQVNSSLLFAQIMHGGINLLINLDTYTGMSG